MLLLRPILATPNANFTPRCRTCYQARFERNFRHSHGHFQHSGCPSTLIRYVHNRSYGVSSVFFHSCFCSSVVGSPTMPCSALGRAKRAFVTVLLSVAVVYNVALQVNRDSEDNQLLQARPVRRPRGCGIFFCREAAAGGRSQRS